MCHNNESDNESDNKSDNDKVHDKVHDKVNKFNDKVNDNPNDNTSAKAKANSDKSIRFAQSCRKCIVYRIDKFGQFGCSIDQLDTYDGHSMH